MRYSGKRWPEVRNSTVMDQYELPVCTSWRRLPSRRNNCRPMTSATRPWICALDGEWRVTRTVRPMKSDAIAGPICSHRFSKLSKDHQLCLKYVQIETDSQNVST